jgi:hypothetical protein
VGSTTTSNQIVTHALQVGVKNAGQLLDPVAQFTPGLRQHALGHIARQRDHQHRNSRC